MTVQSHNNPRCTHCVISDAIIAFRESPGARELVEEQRRRTPDLAYRYSDDQLVRIALMRALGILVVDLLDEEEDGRVKADMTIQHNDAVQTRMILGSLG